LFVVILDSVGLGPPAQ